MKLVTAAEMKWLEERAAKDYGLTGGILMEAAGKAVAEAVLALYRKPRFRVSVVAGLGKNGGDGLVAARYLANAGAEVTVILLGKVPQVAAEAARALVAVQTMVQAGEITLVEWPEGKEVPLEVLRTLSASDVLIDAILGTGKKGLLRPHLRQAIGVVNRAHRPVVAVDLPSGLDANTGGVEATPEEDDGCVRAEVTVTLGCPKVGLYREPGRSFAGRIRVADLGLPRHLLAAPELKTNLITPDLVTRWLPTRPVAAHKGTFGQVLVVGGSVGMSGAPALAGKAALRTGAGLVTVAVPEGIQPVVAGYQAEYMTLPLPQTPAGTVAAEGGRMVLAWLKERMEGRRAVLAIGPGLRVQETGMKVLEEILAADCPCPVVVDADALNTMALAVAKFQEILQARQAPVILTPHPGELARLMGVETALIQGDRFTWARRAAVEWGAVVVLKGWGTVVATPQDEAYLNTTGGPWLATGGSGDVLTGMLAALLAQGLPAEQAAVVGVFLHGAAADQTVREEGSRLLAAGDLLPRIGRVWAALERGEWCEEVV